MKKFSKIIIFFIIATSAIMMTSCQKEEVEPTTKTEINLDSYLTIISQLPRPYVNPDELGRNKSTNNIVTIQLIGFENFVILDDDLFIRRFAYYVKEDNKVIYNGYIIQYFELDDIQNNIWDKYWLIYKIGFVANDGYSNRTDFLTNFGVANSVSLFFTHAAQTDIEGDLMYKISQENCNGENFQYSAWFPPIGEFNLMLQVEDIYYVKEQFNPEEDEFVLFEYEIGSNIEYRFRTLHLEVNADIMEAEIEYQGTNEETNHTIIIDGTTAYIDMIHFPEEIHISWYYLDESNQKIYMSSRHLDDDELEIYGVDPNGVILIQED